MQVPNSSDLKKVQDWLESLGLSEYADAMSAHHIDEWALVRLEEADLREIGVISVGHRKRLMAAIADRIAHITPSPAASTAVAWARMCSV